MIQHPDGSMQQFDNRMRILMNLDDEAFPPALREDNPHSAALWAEGMAERLLAFIRAPDAVRQAIWQALLDHENSDAADPVVDALRTLCRELDQYYDVDDGVGNLPADITKAWMGAQDVLKARGVADA